MRFVFFLGSHPTLSATEVFRFLQRNQCTPKVIIGTDSFLMIEVDRALPDNLLQRLGGTHRIGEVLGQQRHLWKPDEVVSLLSLSSSKITLGLSSLGLPPALLTRLGTALKKLLHSQGHRLRFILPQGRSGQLNTAQVFFNHLYRGDSELELTFIRHRDSYFVVRTVAVQDVQAYAARDTDRPARSMTVGMLPPKVAQMMLNLVPSLPDHAIVYDPFCGSGTILQEGWLHGYTMMGSDASAAMVAASEQNLSWLADHFPVDGVRRPSVFEHDVHIAFPEHLSANVAAVVSEPHLGDPLRSPLPSSDVAATQQSLGELYLTFFHNLLPVLKKDDLVLFLLPAFRQSRRGSAFSLFPDGFLDEIVSLGYGKEQLVPTPLQQLYGGDRRADLLYARPDALVGREFTLWRKLAS